MGFGPFLSKEDKQQANADLMRFMKDRGQGLVSGGPGEMITRAERAKRVQAASPEAMGLITAADQGLLQGIGERITPEENEKRRRAASPKAMGLVPKTPRPEAAIRSSMISNSDYIVPKGQFRGLGQRQKSDGKGGWTDVNIVNNSQPAVLNGKSVRADGKGNWIDMSGKAIGTYKVGQDRSPAVKTETKIEDVKEKPLLPVDPGTPPVAPPTPSADPRNAAYLTARNALTKDSSVADVKAAEDAGMAAWAKANKGLAADVKPGQSGYDQSQDVLGNSTQDQRDAASDRMVMGGNAAESLAGAKGANLEVVFDGAGPEAVTINPQGFKDDAMTALLTNFGNLNVKPIVEGMPIPTTTNYAAAFNQADTPNLQSMMNMGDQLGNYGIESPLFSQGQKFKDLFQNAVLGK